MTTILRQREIKGRGLMKNQECCVVISPSNQGVIRFFVKKNEEPIIAQVDNVVSTDHCVTLGSKHSKIMLVEHFMAACAFCNIDSMDIQVSEAEMPILDGSATGWVKFFKQAGIEKPDKKAYTLTEPVSYLNGKTHLVIVPDEQLTITYGVNYNHPDLRQKWVSYNPKNSEEIISARTFGFLKDLRKFQFFGFAKGVTVENTVGLKDEGYTTDLRSELEPVKHKILDLVGDLYLTGVNPLMLNAQIIVKEAGHAVHVKTAKLLQDKLIEVRR